MINDIEPARSEVRTFLQSCGEPSSINSSLVRAVSYCTLAATLGALSPTTATATNLLDMNFYLSGPSYEGVLPPCDYPKALLKISERFKEKENAFWNSNLQIVGFQSIRETAYRPGAADTIPARFCSGLVYVSDGRSHTIHYSIIEDGGMIGARWGVEWCVAGLDRNWAYSPACTTALP